MIQELTISSKGTSAFGCPRHRIWVQLNYVFAGYSAIAGVVVYVSQ
jgi:hypothetical protein